MAQKTYSPAPSIRVVEVSPLDAKAVTGLLARFHQELLGVAEGVLRDFGLDRSGLDEFAAHYERCVVEWWREEVARAEGAELDLDREYTPLELYRVMQDVVEMVRQEGAAALREMGREEAAERFLAAFPEAVKFIRSPGETDAVSQSR